MIDAAALAKLSLFSTIEPGYLQVLAKNLRPLSIEAGERLVEEEVATRGPLFLITEGHLEVTRKDAHGAPHVLAKLSPPTVVGEMEFLADVKSSATVRATSRLAGYLLPRERFEALFAANEPAAFHLALAIGRMVSHRLAQTNALLTKALSNTDVLVKKTSIAKRTLDEVDAELEELLNQ